MAIPSNVPRLQDIIEAIEHIHECMAEASLEDFEADWRRQWLVERGVEIISEASRHLDDELKARHPEIPWRKVAGIGNVLRHSYETVAAAVLWKLAQSDLQPLEKVCREEFEAVRKDPARE
ncbi:DUF86 domain-containing protein [Methylosinus sp. H3A]|uniref:HepT-like ribonuclease domain-containing protein n=1 Tax=Methylosinus sp. H3A TaxID=2785786 RepID=UPI0018C2ECDD|nr:HepT-like ribonuclease domain-containing protein [Methylosinus sp. H3A]MBG0808888.1 DUF86 domain-containing protein [Methylosinus sp. H3A]